MGTEGAGPRELPAALLLFTWPDSATHYQRWLHFSGKKKQQQGACPLHGGTLPTWPAPLHSTSWPWGVRSESSDPRDPGHQAGWFLLLAGTLMKVELPYRSSAGTSTKTPQTGSQ